ncbi:MAG: Crp/Fnr family transcriptional regulator [Spirochaetota bacterium]
MDANYEKLIDCPLFSTFTAEELRTLLSPSGCTFRAYPSGSIIMSQGERYTDLYVLLEGQVSAKFYEFSGKSMLVETLNAPDPIALAIIFADVNYLPVTTEADSDVKVAVIKKKALINLMQSSSELLSRYLREMGSKVVFLAEKMRLAEMASLRQKIADFLLRMRDQYNRNDFQLPYSREKLAELLGSARPSLSRELSRMAEDSIIAVDGRHVRILDPESLQDSLMF